MKQAADATTTMEASTSERGLVIEHFEPHLEFIDGAAPMIGEALLDEYLCRASDYVGYS